MYNKEQSDNRWIGTSRKCSENSHRAQCMRCIFNAQCDFRKDK